MIRIRQIKIKVENDNIGNLKSSIAKKLRISINEINNFNIHKKSIDARDKNNIYFVYEVNVSIKFEHKVLKKIKSNDIFIAPDTSYKFSKTGINKLNNRPVIIGSGPAGLFAAYILAENNYKPIIIERGEKMEDRIKSVEEFWKTGKLNTNSNVQFGEGGAGTFSDGKLNTLNSDVNNRGRKVFETFIKFGAPKEILYDYKPHIGTDLLKNVIINMRNQIIDMGGEFSYNTCFNDIEIENNKLKKIKINDTWIDTDILILALGHSARDTFKMLYDKNIKMESKPFAIGLRVQHPQELINESQYGKKYKDLLPNATYKLTYKASNGKGVYSFCMCPGGYVVNASSEARKLSINGMSYHARNSKNANSAIVVTISQKDYGNNTLDGIKFQRDLEEKTYNLGNGKIPIQLLKDFKSNKKSDKLGIVEPIFKGDYALSNINDILPQEVSDSINEAFLNFGKKIKGFDMDDTILAAIESRTSSPVRIIRNDDFESNILGIYPCGEGAGYAGGITTAAIDGIKVAESIGRKYKSYE